MPMSTRYNHTFILVKILILWIGNMDRYFFFICICPFKEQAKCNIITVCSKLPEQCITFWMSRNSNRDCFPVSNLFHLLENSSIYLKDYYIKYENIFTKILKLQIYMWWVTLIIESPPSFRIDSLNSPNSFLVHIEAAGTIC